jgi:hypothetical protein
MLGHQRISDDAVFTKDTGGADLIETH